MEIKSLEDLDREGCQAAIRMVGLSGGKGEKNLAMIQIGIENTDKALYTVAIHRAAKKIGTPGTFDMKELDANHPINVVGNLFATSLSLSGANIIRCKPSEIRKILTMGDGTDFVTAFVMSQEKWAMLRTVIVNKSAAKLGEMREIIEKEKAQAVEEDEWFSQAGGW